jgi:hypothetical protein
MNAGPEVKNIALVVSTHLYQVFPKLGITSRAALRDALGDIPPE